MAQLNPTFGKFNKFDIVKGTAQSPSVFGNDVQPSGQNFGFDSSSNQSGVSVYFGKSLRAGLSTQLEIWLWDGSSWSLWTTLDGNHANFKNLEGNTVNFAWTMEGTTYSKMYLNAKNLNNKTMKLRVTGQIGNILIDNDRADGTYDLELKVSPTGNTESITPENSTRQAAIESLEGDKLIEKNRANAAKLSLEAEISLNESKINTIKNSSETELISINQEIIDQHVSAKASAETSVLTYRNSIITEINSKDEDLKIGDGTTWLDTEYAKHSYYYDAVNEATASADAVIDEENSIFQAMIGNDPNITNFSGVWSHWDQAVHSIHSVIQSNESSMAAIEAEISHMESIAISMETVLNPPAPPAAGPVPAIFAENAKTEHGYGVDNATITQTVGHWLTTPEYPTMDYNGGTFKNYKANETSRSSTLLSFATDIIVGQNVTLTTNTTNFNVSQGEFLHISLWEENGLNRTYFDATLVSFTDNGNGTGTLVCTVTKAMNPSGYAELDAFDWHIVGGHTLGNGILESKNPNAVDWTAWEYNDFFWGANNNKAPYNYPLYNLLGSIWYNYINYAPTIHWQRFFATIWEGGTEAEIEAAGAGFWDDGMDTELISRFATNHSSYQFRTYLKGDDDPTKWSCWAVGQVIQKLKNSNHNNLTEKEVFDSVQCLRDFISKVKTMAYSARNYMTEFRITNLYKNKLAVPRDIWNVSNSGQTFYRIYGHPGESTQWNGYESPFPFDELYHDDADYDYNLLD